MHRVILENDERIVDSGLQIGDYHFQCETFRTAGVSQGCRRLPVALLSVAKPGGFEWGVVKPEGQKFEAECRERG